MRTSLGVEQTLRACRGNLFSVAACPSGFKWMQLHNLQLASIPSFAFCSKVSPMSSHTCLQMFPLPDLAGFVYVKEGRGCWEGKIRWRVSGEWRYEMKRLESTSYHFTLHSIHSSLGRGALEKVLV